MKTIKLIIYSILLLAIYSCQDHACTSDYHGSIRIDGKKDEKVTIKYIGPQKQSYEKEFNFQLENKLPFSYIDFIVNTTCDTKDFKNNNYNFLEIKNTTSEDIYICAVISNEETPNRFKEDKNLLNLLHIYSKQDKDSNYDYTKDENLKDTDYLDKEKLYKKLLEEKYPYIIKLAPNKTCIMKWGGFGFQFVE